MLTEGRLVCNTLPGASCLARPRFRQSQFTCIITSDDDANDECGLLTRFNPGHDLARLNTMLSLSLIAGP